MPAFDSKRINGPSDSQPLSLFLKKETGPELLLDELDKRIDGRSANEIRPLYMKAGIVTKANGSCFVETSGTKLVCAVYGPRDYIRRQQYSNTGRLSCEVNFAPFSRQSRVKPQADAEKELRNRLVEAIQCSVCLDAFPKAQVDIYVSVLEDNGSTLSHAIVAASIALADAGIEMYDMVTSASLIFNEDSYFIDPCNREIAHATTQGSLTLAFMPSLNQVTCLLSDGQCDIDDSKKLINVAIEACLRLHASMRECLTRSMKQKSQKR